jgi:hypothetical protein
MEPQHEPMVIGLPSVQCIVQLLAGCLDPPVGEFGQLERISDVVDHRLDYSPATEAHDIGDHRVEFDVGLLQRLLNPPDMAGLLARQLLAGTQQRPQLLDLLFRTKLALINPQLTRSAIHMASFLMCLALATISSNVPSLRIFHTGFQ